MRKIPIILSSLALAGAVTPVRAKELTEDDYLAPGETINVVYNEVKVSEIDPYGSTVMLNFSAYYSVEGKRPTKIYLASYDYKTGVSIAEADKRAENLGEMNREDWMGYMLDHTVKNAAEMISVAIGNTVLLNDNPTDIIYYAVKFENPSRPELGVDWVRGKADYRECIHSEPFQSKRATSCKLTKDNARDAYRYAPAKYALTNSPVLSWPAEMRMLLEEEWNTIATGVQELETKHEDYQEIAETTIQVEEKKVNDFEGLLKKLGKGEDFAAEITEMRERLEALRTAKEKPEELEPEEEEESEGKEEGDDSEGSGGEEGLEGEEEEPEEKEGEDGPEGSEEEGETGGETGKEDGGMGGEMGGENTPERPLEGPQSDEKDETPIDPSTNVSAAQTAPTGPTTQENGQGATGSATNLAQNGTSAAGTGNGASSTGTMAAEGDEGTDGEEVEEIEVPILGGEGDDMREEVSGEMRATWWLWIILVVAAGGLTVWWVRRAFFKRERHAF